jgi:pseudouridine synthase
MPPIRLSKILAQSGLASRRGAEALLVEGRVTVNGVVRREPGAQADPAADVITLDGRRVAAPEPTAYVLLHKPRGYVTSLRDPEGRPVVLDLLPRELPRVFPVGRLDYDTEGLLLLTNDGELANYLLHPRYEIPRVYEAEVQGRVTPADVPRWRRGTALADGPAVPTDVRILRARGRTTWLRLTLTEGRNREVRRYCQALGHRVVRLRRIEFGPLRLGDLAPGASRPLTGREVAALNRLRGGDRSPIMRRIC